MLEGLVPWSVESVEAQRLEFCGLAVSGSGVSFTELCRRYGISRKTGYQWLGVYRVEGPGGLRDRRRVPKNSPTRTCATTGRHGATPNPDSDGPDSRSGS